MSAVVRVKRKITEDPLTALVLNCKRRKGENGDHIENNLPHEDKECYPQTTGAEEESSTILKFAGTVNSQEKDISTQLKKLNKEEAKYLVQKQLRQPGNLTERNRLEMRHNLHENRFRVVNCYRMIRDDIQTEDEDDNQCREITVVDIEKQSTSVSAKKDEDDIKKSSSSNANIAIPSTSTSFPSPSDEQESSEIVTENNYVYDLYLPENTESPQNFDYNETSLSVRPFDDLVFEDYSRDSDNENDSADSNAENYYTNDYPDEEGDDSSINERDIVRAVGDLDLGEGGDLSTDDDGDYYGDERYGAHYNNGYVHSIDLGDEYGFEDDVDYCKASSHYTGKTKRSKNDDYDECDSDLNDEDDDDPWF